MNSHVVVAEGLGRTSWTVGPLTESAAEKLVMQMQVEHPKLSCWHEKLVSSSEFLNLMKDANDE
jgi:hypothetical protein